MFVNTRPKYEEKIYISRFGGHHWSYIRGSRPKTIDSKALSLHTHILNVKGLKEIPFQVSRKMSQIWYFAIRLQREGLL